MSVAPKEELTPIQALHDQQREVLESLLDALGEDQFFTLRALELAQKGLVLDMPKILEPLGVQQDWTDKSKAVYRGRVMLRKAFPNHPIRAYNNLYIEKMLQVLPVVFLNKGNFSPKSRPERHIDRFNNWLGGLSLQQMTEAEGIRYQPMIIWTNDYFPREIKKRLSFYDIVHAADHLSQAEDLSSGG